MLEIKTSRLILVSSTQNQENTSSTFIWLRHKWNMNMKTVFNILLDWRRAHPACCMFQTLWGRIQALQEKRLLVLHHENWCKHRHNDGCCIHSREICVYSIVGALDDVWTSRWGGNKGWALLLFICSAEARRSEHRVRRMVWYFSDNKSDRAFPPSIHVDDKRRSSSAR